MKQKFQKVIYLIRKKFLKNSLQKLYNIRNKHPINLTCQLIMNSLYGKLAMRSDISKMIVVDLNDTDNKSVEDNKLVWINESYTRGLIKIINKQTIEFKNKKDICLYTIKDGFELKDQENQLIGLDTSIPIPAAIAAAIDCIALHCIAARIFMYKNIKNNPKYKLYYTDTDSIVVGVGKQQTIIII